MNKRIDDLMYESGLTAQGCWDSMDKYDQEAIMKFGHLIVRECMTLCKTSVGNADYNTGRMHCASDIKEHFGVEE